MPDLTPADWILKLNHYPGFYSNFFSAVLSVIDKKKINVKIIMIKSVNILTDHRFRRPLMFSSKTMLLSLS